MVSQPELDIELGGPIGMRVEVEFPAEEMEAEYPV